MYPTVEHLNPSANTNRPKGRAVSTVRGRDHNTQFSTSPDLQSIQPARNVQCESFSKPHGGPNGQSAPAQYYTLTSRKPWWSPPLFHTHFSCSKRHTAHRIQPAFVSALHRLATQAGSILATKSPELHMGWVSFTKGLSVLPYLQVQGEHSWAHRDSKPTRREHACVHCGNEFIFSEIIYHDQRKMHHLPEW